MDERALPDRIETPRLTLRKSRFADWRDLYENIWSRPESARYMLWSVTTSESDARARMERTLAWEQTHPGKYSVEEKASGAVIGWAGIERLSDGVWGETGRPRCTDPAAGAEKTFAPHSGQNEALSGSLAPHSEQNFAMGRVPPSSDGIKNGGGRDPPPL